MIHIRNTNCNADIPIPFYVSDFLELREKAAVTLCGMVLLFSRRVATKEIRDVQRNLDELRQRRYAMSNVILRLPQVKIKVGLSRSSIYAAAAQGKFPNPIRLRARAVGWLESEIEDWIRERVKYSRGCHESSAH